jgi:hypothetical protein
MTGKLDVAKQGRHRRIDEKPIADYDTRLEHLAALTTRDDLGIDERVEIAETLLDVERDLSDALRYIHGIRVDSSMDEADILSARRAISALVSVVAFCQGPAAGKPKDLAIPEYYRLGLAARPE